MHFALFLSFFVASMASSRQVSSTTSMNTVNRFRTWCGAASKYLKSPENMEYFSKLATAITTPSNVYHTVQLSRIRDEMVTKREFQELFDRLEARILSSL